jgi:hypothetical protein
MMQFSGEIPPSTVIVGGALWTVLFGLLVWLLVSVNQQSIDIKEIATQQNSSSKEVNKDLTRMGTNIDRIEEHNRDQDRRITVLERERR